MKRLIYILGCLLLTISVYSQGNQPVLAYTINYVDTENALNEVSLFITEPLTVDWGDGAKETLSPGTFGGVSLAHTYSATGEYSVSVYGSSEAITRLSLPDETYLSSLKIGVCDKLEDISCYGMHTLEVTNASMLKNICNNTGEVSSLNLSGAPNLEYLDISGNPIEKDKVALLEMVESLPDRTGKDPGILMISMGNFPRHKAICERKNWTIK